MYQLVLDQGIQRASETELKKKMIVWILFTFFIFLSINSFIVV